MFKNQLYIDIDEELTEKQNKELELIISNHDGAEADVFSKTKRESREEMLFKMVQQAKYNPEIDNIELANYLVKINAQVNVFIITNIIEPVINTVVHDKENSKEFKSFLNKVVNTEGMLSWQYLIKGLQDAQA